MEKHGINIGGRPVGKDSPVFIIAEAGINHNGDLAMARELVSSAADCGADAVKFQTFKADRVVTAGAPKAMYQLEVTDKSESQLEMLEKVELGESEHRELKALAEGRGMVFLSTPYNFEDIELLEAVGVDAYKVASGQIIEHVFLERVVATGKPLLLSTGMATMAEVEAAVKVIERSCEGPLEERLILMQCTTNYPSPIEDANLRVIETLRSRFGCQVGYSDHTLGDEAVIAAVALGASVIEKHYTLDKSLPGPDHQSSATPLEFKELVGKIRRTEVAMGSAVKEPTNAEISNAKGMRRSLATAHSIKRGEVIGEEVLTFKRPSTGMEPGLYKTIVGKKAAKDIEAGVLLEKDMVE